MKSRTLTSITAMTLFTALATPVQLAAQDDAAQAKKAQPHHYKFIDLGTLGGPTNYLSVNGPGLPILNDAGVVSSSADTSIPDPNAPNHCFSPGPECLLIHAYQWQDGVLMDIGALPGVNSSAAGAINAQGWSVGQSQNGETDALTGFPEIRAVLWKGRQIIDLGTLGGNESLATDVNNSGQVVGAAANNVVDPFSLFGFGTQTRAFLWQRGAIQDLGTLGGPDAAALSVNERGQVAGISYISATPNPSGSPTIDPFLWDHGRMIDLGTLGGTNSNVGSQALVVNNRGQVAGTSSLAGDVGYHAFLWERGTLTDLGTLGGTFSTIFWLNDAGDVVGGSFTPGNASIHAALWRKGVISDLGTLDGDCFSEAHAINANGEIVGGSLSCDFSTARAVLWENGSIIDLNSLIPADSNLVAIDGANINDRGEILGQGLPPGAQNGDNGGHLFLLIPCGDDSNCSEDNTEGKTTATQNNRVPILNNIPTSTRPRLGPSDIVALWRARLAQRRHLPVPRAGLME